MTPTMPEGKGGEKESNRDHYAAPHPVSPCARGGGGEGVPQSLLAPDTEKGGGKKGRRGNLLRFDSCSKGRRKGEAAPCSCLCEKKEGRTIPETHSSFAGRGEKKREEKGPSSLKTALSGEPLRRRRGKKGKGEVATSTTIAVATLSMLEKKEGTGCRGSNGGPVLEKGGGGGKGGGPGYSFD